MTLDAVPGVAEAEAAAVPEASAPNVVRLPNGHVVTLRPELSVALGMAALRALTTAQGLGIEAAEYALVSLWLGMAPSGEAYTIESWDFTDASGEVAPITGENIVRLLPFNDGGYEVAGAAGRLYGEHVMRPFLRLIERPSKRGQTDGGMRPRSLNGHAPQVPSGRSSPPRGRTGKP